MNVSVIKEKGVSSDKKTLEEHIQSLKTGYEQMSRINLELAENAVASDNDALFLAEQNLRSVKNSDS